jgi:hypothetical protein
MSARAKTTVRTTPSHTPSARPLLDRPITHDRQESGFDDFVTSHGAGADTTVVVAGIDPAGERALLKLLWDTGHDVVSMTATR